MQCDRDQTEDGFALVITLVLLLLLTMTGVGILYIGAEETLIMRNTELGLRFRLASESVLRRGVTEIEWGEYHTLPVGEVIEWTEEYSGLSLDLVLERLDERFLIFGAEVAEEGAAGSGVGLVVALIDQIEIWEGFPAALTTPGTVRVAAGAGLRGYDTSLELGCEAEVVDILQSAFGTTTIPPRAQLADDRGTELRLGPLTPMDLSRVVDWTEKVGKGSAPRLYYTGSDLELNDGRWEGILIVEGDLELGGRVVVEGLILVGGDLRMTNEARIDGALAVPRRGSKVELDDRATITYDPCQIERAVGTSMLTELPYLPADGGWIPWF